MTSQFHDVGGCCSDLVLDRFRSGEMNDDEASAQRAHLASSSTCSARLAVLHAAGVEFSALPLPDFAALAARTDPVSNSNASTVSSNASTVSSNDGPHATVTRLRSRRSWAFAGGASVFAAAAAVVVFVVVPDADTRVKGDGPPATVELFVRRDDHVRAAVDAAPLRAGDVVRARAHAQRTAFVGVVEVEADGDVARHLPASGPLQHVDAGDTDLDGASQLDDQPGPIDLVALVCDRAIDVDDAVLAGVARGDAPAGCALEHHRFEKAGR